MVYLPIMVTADEQRKHVEALGREAAQRSGRLSPQTCHRVAELMKPAINKVVRERRAAQARARQESG